MISWRLISASSATNAYSTRVILRSKAVPYDRDPPRLVDSVDDPLAAAHAVSISVSFAFIRRCPPIAARIFRRRSRTVAIEYERITVVLKIGRSAARLRPWPPPLHRVNAHLW